MISKINNQASGQTNSPNFTGAFKIVDNKFVGTIKKGVPMDPFSFAHAKKMKDIFWSSKVFVYRKKTYAVTESVNDVSIIKQLKELGVKFLYSSEDLKDAARKEKNVQQFFNREVSKLFRP